VFIAEGFASNTGKCLEWASSIGNYHRCYFFAKKDEILVFMENVNRPW